MTDLEALLAENEGLKEALDSVAPVVAAFAVTTHHAIEVVSRIEVALRETHPDISIHAQQVVGQWRELLRHVEMIKASAVLQNSPTTGLRN